MRTTLPFLRRSFEGCGRDRARKRVPRAYALGGDAGMPMSSSVGVKVPWI